MEETGIVTGVQGRMARVRLMRQATCDRCGICGIGQRPEIEVEVPNSAGARPGDQVRLAVESGAVLRAAVAAYVVPLAAWLAGYLLLSAILGVTGVGRFREALAIAGGFLCLGLSYFWIRSYDRRAGDRFVPRMIEVVSPEDGRQEPPKAPGC